MKITKFQVFGLHGRTDVHIPIVDNRLVIVGANGAGKSTVLSILYYLLARRWGKLSELPFASVCIELNGELLTLTRDEIANSNSSYGSWRRILRSYTPYAAEYLNNPVVQEILQQPKLSDLDVHRLSQIMNIPRLTMRRLQTLWEERGEQGKLDFVFNFTEANRKISDATDGQILYLPTYRRIEKELKAVVPDIEERVRQYEERYGAGRKRAYEATSSPLPYVDLIEFGMDDVKQIIEGAAKALTDFSRQQLNELTGAYLGEVVRGEVERFVPSNAAEFDDKEINSILARIDERTLTENDKSMLRDVLGKLHTVSGHLSTRERYIAHFFAKLSQVASRIQSRETAIRNFVGVCNENYLVGKQFHYNRNDFSLDIRDGDGNIIALRDLSSGEKQVVSLFSHIHLGAREKYIVLIDEPELSLSVDWQENLLPDIMSSKRCTFLAAVTHSPFIYDNEFQANTVDLIAQASPTETLQL